MTTQTDDAPAKTKKPTMRQWDKWLRMAYELEDDARRFRDTPEIADALRHIASPLGKFARHYKY